MHLFYFVDLISQYTRIKYLTCLPGQIEIIKRKKKDVKVFCLLILFAFITVWFLCFLLFSVLHLIFLFFLASSNQNLFLLWLLFFLVRFVTKPVFNPTPLCNTTGQPLPPPGPTPLCNTTGQLFPPLDRLLCILFSSSLHTSPQGCRPYSF